MNIKYPNMRTNLLKMMEKDQYLRHLPEVDNDLLRDTDIVHTNHLRKIINLHGWPTISMVGEDGSRAAWIIAQHSMHDHKFMEQALKRMNQFVDSNEVSLIDVAYLSDRVNMQSSRPQRYGTQFVEVNINGIRHGGVWPLEDPERVDEFRSAINMEPFENIINDLPLIPKEMTIEDIKKIAVDDIRLNKQ